VGEERDTLAEAADRAFRSTLPGAGFTVSQVPEAGPWSQVELSNGRITVTVLYDRPEGELVVHARVPVRQRTSSTWRR
jgi:hypothetical protein